MSRMGKVVDDRMVGNQLRDGNVPPLKDLHVTGVGSRVSKGADQKVEECTDLMCIVMENLNNLMWA